MFTDKNKIQQLLFYNIYYRKNPNINQLDA